MVQTMYFYIKALHIIFVVTWFAGLFYIVRLFIYSAEANLKPEPEKTILFKQLALMQNRLWYIITWPSAILTLIFGGWLWYLYRSLPTWLLVKLCFVLGLFLYHLSLHAIFKQQQKGIFKYSSQQLRMWNELATLFLIIIVMLAVVKQMLSVVWGISGLFAFAIVLMIAIKLYKKYRKD
ncbi:MAG: protoporphyrinogen oxidase [Chitinophagaceae bacterium]|nr:protoporphyrinogen oxidase [Chitinophagaceae bacterium]